MAPARNKHYQQYDKQDLASAVAEALHNSSDGQPHSLRAIADKYGVPRSTLHSHVKANGVVRSSGGATVLYDKTEATLASWLHDCNRQMLPPSIPTFQAKVGRVLALQNAAHSELRYFTVDGKPSLEPSRKWVERFAERHHFNVTHLTLSQQRALGLLEDSSSSSGSDTGSESDRDGGSGTDREQQQEQQDTSHAGSHQHQQIDMEEEEEGNEPPSSTAATCNQNKPGPSSTTTHQPPLPGTPPAAQPARQMSSPQIRELFSKAAALLRDPAQAHRPCVQELRFTLTQLAVKQQQRELEQLQVSPGRQHVEEVAGMSDPDTQQQPQQEGQEEEEEEVVEPVKKTSAGGSTKRRGVRLPKHAAGSGNSKKRSKRVSSRSS
jgi:hypothetical protein